MFCNLFWFSFSFAEYSTILIFGTYNAYQMQIQTSCLHPHVVLFLLYVCHLTDVLLLGYGVVHPSVCGAVPSYVASSTILVGRIYEELCLSRWLKLSICMYTLYGKRKKPIFFKFKVQGHWTFIKIPDTWTLMCAGYSKNYVYAISLKCFVLLTSNLNMI